MPDTILEVLVALFLVSIIMLFLCEVFDFTFLAEFFGDLYLIFGALTYLWLVLVAVLLVLGII